MAIRDIFNRTNTNPLATTNLDQETLYERLQTYYDNNDLYYSIQKHKYEQGEWFENIKPFKTPVNRSVEFYTSRLCQNEVTISTVSEKVSEAVKQVLKWSNFSSQKRMMVRGMSLFGDLFIKVVSTKDKVYSENIEPKYVTDFKTDYRGYIQEIRIDIPMTDEDGRAYNYTEFWNKEYFSSWNHNYGKNAELEQLGEPAQFLFLNQLGIDFIPIVWIPFKQVSGKKRGESCVGHALLKIDEVNRITTRLHQLLWRYNKPTFAVSANATDKNGRPLPAPVVKGKTPSTEANADLLTNEVVYLPGMSSLESLIPNINYDSALAVITAMENELEKDLPELRYNSLNDTDLSGKALRIVLGASVDRAEEAKNNFVSGIVRMIEMSLTIGTWMGIFRGIGTYENGDFEIGMDFGEIFPIGEEERAELLKTLTESGLPLGSAMKLAGYEEEVIEEAVTEKETSDNKALSSFVNNFNEQ